MKDGQVVTVQLKIIMVNNAKTIVVTKVSVMQDIVIVMKDGQEMTVLKKINVLMLTVITVNAHKMPLEIQYVHATKAISVQDVYIKTLVKEKNVIMEFVLS
mmetsp:Transcript_122565/g.183305  ORF Transcript_122565/g.183305 Transcript_122565/m.183305 type:complete len:101 (-) Transcript_122565:318-620(-)